MRARGEIEGYRATARLDVNGNAVGEVELEPTTECSSLRQYNLDVFSAG